MMGPSASARWCPTPDQLMILEEMYRAGVRTPNASQIQQITAHLSLYGKIEGKNVFYWFQNHKARDRQKLRRKLSKQLQLQLQFQHQHHHQQQLFQPHVSDTSFLRSYLDLSPSVSACGSLQQQLAHFSSPLSPTAGSYIPQGGHSGSSSRQQMMQYNWKRNDQMDQECNNMMKRYSGGWMMLLDMDSPDLCATRPVKTLQLFPTTSAGLKEDPKVPPS